MTGVMTSKGQVTIPVEVRRRLGLRAGTRLEFVVTEDGRLEVVPLCASVTQLRGILPRPSRPLSLADMDEAIAAGAKQ